MITAVLVVITVAILSATAYSLSAHDLHASGLDRSRVQSVAAAEGGLDRFYLFVEQTPVGFLPCNSPFTNQSMATAPSARYTLPFTQGAYADGKGVYYSDSAGTLPVNSPGTLPPIGISCTGTYVPAGTPALSMLVRSVGTEANSTRTMESLVRLSVKQGGTFGSDAVYADSSASFNGGIGVNDNPVGYNNADVFSNGPIVLKGGGTGINGAVRSQSTVDVSGGTNVKGDIFAKQAVTIGGGSIAFGNVNSSTSTIAVNGSKSTINKDANACTGISASNGGAISGTQRPNACPAPPPSRSFNYYTYNFADWNTAANPYSEKRFTDCTAARNFITSIPSGNYVVLITGCLLQFNKNTVISLTGDLAIITDGGITLNANSYFQSGNPPTTHNLALMSGIGGSVGCNNDINLSGANYASLNVLFYTPCHVKETSGTFTASGQIYAGSVSFNSQATLTFNGFLIPGLGNGNYNQDIAYIREVK